MRLVSTKIFIFSNTQIPKNFFVTQQNLLFAQRVWPVDITLKEKCFGLYFVMFWVEVDSGYFDLSQSMIITTWMKIAEFLFQTAKMAVSCFD